MVALANSASISALLARGKTIYDEVRAGRFQHGWCPITLTDGVDTLEVMVSCDALKMPVETVDQFGTRFADPATRVNVDAFTQQEIADELGAVLLTPLLVDRIYERSPKLSPTTRAPTAEMATTREMILHSQAVDQKLAQDPGRQPVANVGKDWVLTGAIFTPNAIDKNRSANYGWLGAGNSRSVTGIPLWQGIGLVHEAGRPGETGHTDYSQVARFAHRSARLNGDPVDLADVYTGRVGGTRLVSHEGPLPSFRIPQAQGAPPPPPGPPPPPFGPPSPPPAPPTEEPPETAPAAKKKGAGRVVGGGIVGAGIGWAAAGPVGALVGAIIGGVAGGATR